MARIIPDEDAFQGWPVKPLASMDSLYNTSFKQLRQVVIDFGDHYAGYFSFKLSTLRGTADDPLRFRFTFGEVPSELAVPFDPYSGGLGRAWWIFIDCMQRLHKQAAIQGLMIYALQQTYALASL
jgi:alpha-L-rhamnosidase